MIVIAELSATGPILQTTAMKEHIIIDGVGPEARERLRPSLHKGGIGGCFGTKGG